ncbi:hypothetical protein MKX01_028016 [Papaver californicum]|nr:hypothetical protein MKX01_016567 [Papaver californicum]KAI3996071.1 hypothetical protein MKX01_028016 [Papaver californicum]
MAFSLCCYKDDQIVKQIGKRITTPLREIGNFVSKTRNVTTVKHHPKPEKKTVQTQTYYSVLTAPSRTLYVHKDSIVNIDAEDVNDPLAAVEYVKDLYKFYKIAESSSRVRSYMNLQKEITERMRMILVDCLVVRKKELLLIGITAMLIVSKYEEIAATEVDELVDISDRIYNRELVLAMEKSILGKLGWTLTIPTTYHFLVRFIKASSVAVDKETKNMVFFLAELGLVQYAILKYSPHSTLKKTPYWNKTLKHYTGFYEYELIKFAKQLARFHSDAPEHELRAVYNKYSTCAHNIVSLLPPTQSLGF